jgi:hypothetical protein
MPTPTNTPEPGDPTMHVGDLDGSSTNQGRTWTAYVTITVVDDSGSPVANAAVEGNWSNRGTDPVSCTTNGSGQCTLNQSDIRKNVSSIAFEVTDVSHSTLTYDAAANSDPDGDSSGTIIIVSKP